MSNNLISVVAFIVGIIFTILWFFIKSKKLRAIVIVFMFLSFAMCGISLFYSLKTEIEVTDSPLVIKEHYYAKKLPNVINEGGDYEGADTDLFTLRFSIKPLNGKEATNFRENVKIILIKNGVQYKLLDTVSSYPKTIITNAANLLYPFRCHYNFFGDTSYLYLNIDFSNGVFPQEPFKDTFCNYGRPNFTEVKK